MQEDKLAALLLEDQKVSEAQLQQARSLMSATGGDLGQLLMKLGFIDGEVLSTYKAKVDGVESVDVGSLIIPENLVTSVPRESIEKYRVLPIRKDGNTLTLAMADAENFEAIEEIRFLTGMKINAVVAAPDALAKAITTFFDRLDAAEAAEKEEADEDAAVGVAAPSGDVSIDIEMPTDQVALELGLERLLEPRYQRALVPLLIAKGIITEAELAEQVRKIEDD